MDAAMTDPIGQDGVAAAEHEHGVNTLSGTAGEEQAAIGPPRLCPCLFCLGDAVHVLSVQVAGGGQLGEVQTGVFCWQAGDGFAFVAWHGHTERILGGKLGQSVIEGGRHRGFLLMGL